jgi:hypothetical protein
MKERGNIGVVKGHQMIIQFINRIIPKKTTHPGVKHRWQFPVVGRQYASRTIVATSILRPNQRRIGASSVQWRIGGFCRPNLRDMRDYSLEGSCLLEHSPVFRTSGYFHIRRTSLTRSEGNLLRSSQLLRRVLSSDPHSLLFGDGLVMLRSTCVFLVLLPRLSSRSMRPILVNARAYCPSAQQTAFWFLRRGVV